jgi:hypothetical protein
MYLWLYEPVRELYTCFFENASPLFEEDRIAEEAVFCYLTLPFGVHTKT